MPGRPIKVTEPVLGASAQQEVEEGRFQFNRNFPESISSTERLANSQVVIVSVAGAFRKGKSFLLNFFLRYLRALSRGDTQDWIRSASQLDDGFPWRSGAERDTTGILIWSEPFFIKKPNGEEVAVLLMDTQGTFDHQSTQQDCATIFAFSTLMSSVQIFNISQNIQETDLQHLRLFVEFASMAKNSRGKVLQHLWFLIRDWQNPDEYNYGGAGGDGYLRKVLACDDSKPRENKEVRRGISQQFEMASCFLLPYPGKAVTRKDYKGQVDKLDDDFVQFLDQFVRRILSPEKLVAKTVNGRKITGRELYQLVEVYFEAFRCGNLPNPKSIFTATVEMANQAASADAVKFFEDIMGLLPGPAISDEDLSARLGKAMQKAMQQFDSGCMEKGSLVTDRTREKLKNKLCGLFQQQRTLNKLKSEKIEAEEKNRMLMGDIQRIQDESVETVKKMQQMEANFAKKVAEIQLSSASKEEMEKMLQMELVKHSAAQKELEKQNDDLKKRIKEMAESNQKIMSELTQSKREAKWKHQAMMDQWKMRMEAEQEKHHRAVESSLNFISRIVVPIVAHTVAYAVSSKCRIS